MQIGKTTHLKTCEDFGKTINEDSRGLGRHLKREEFCSHVPRHFIWEQTPKKTKKQAITHRNTYSGT